MQERIEEEADAREVSLSSNELLLSAFKRRVQANLHVVVCLNPASTAFVPALAANPALTSKAQVVWVADWLPTSIALLPRLLLPSPLGGNASLTDDEIALGYESGNGATDQLA